MTAYESLRREQEICDDTSKSPPQPKLGGRNGN